MPLVPGYVVGLVILLVLMVHLQVPAPAKRYPTQCGCTLSGLQALQCKWLADDGATVVGQSLEQSLVKSFVAAAMHYAERHRHDSTDTHTARQLLLGLIS